MYMTKMRSLTANTSSLFVVLATIATATVVPRDVAAFTLQNSRDAYSTFNSVFAGAKSLDIDRSTNQKRQFSYLYKTSQAATAPAAVWIQAIFGDTIMDASNLGHPGARARVDAFFAEAFDGYNNFNWGDGTTWLARPNGGPNSWLNAPADDMLWWILALIRADEITGGGRNGEYLETALAGFEKVTSNRFLCMQNGVARGIRWDWENQSGSGQCGEEGQEECDTTGDSCFLSSCANFPAIIAAIKLYRLTGDTTKLDFARNTYSSLAPVFDAVTGAVYDGMGSSNSTGGGAFSTYNLGTFIGASVLLYQETNHRDYLFNAKLATEFAKNVLSDEWGIVPSEDRVLGEYGVFKNILARYVMLLNDEIPDPQFMPWLQLNASTAMANSFSSGKGPITCANFGLPCTQIPRDTAAASGGVAFMQLVPPEGVVVYDDDRYRKIITEIPISAGYHTSVGAMTSIRVPPGWKVVAYESTDWSGTPAATFTQDQSNVGGALNDKLRSMVVMEAPGVTIFRDDQFRGPGVYLPEGEYNYYQLRARGIRDNSMTSLRVSAGYTAEVWDTPDFSGGSPFVKYTATTGNVGTTNNDRMSSVKVYRTSVGPIAQNPAVVFFNDVPLSGTNHEYSPGDYNASSLNSPMGGTGWVSSISVPPGYTAELYDDDNLTGTRKTLSYPTDWLASFNDRIQSARISAMTVPDIAANKRTIPDAILSNGDSCLNNDFQDPRALVDSSPGTIWRWSVSQPVDWKIDLGSVRNFRSVSLYWDDGGGNASCSSIKVPSMAIIETSIDGSTWIARGWMLPSDLANGGGVYGTITSNVSYSAQFFRARVASGPSGMNYAGLRGFRVWESAPTIDAFQ